MLYMNRESKRSKGVSKALVGARRRRGARLELMDRDVPSGIVIALALLIVLIAVAVPLKMLASGIGAASQPQTSVSTIAPRTQLATTIATTTIPVPPGISYNQTIVQSNSVASNSVNATLASKVFNATSLVSSCDTIYNLTQTDAFDISGNGIDYVKGTVNFVTPNYAGLTINNNYYETYPNVTYQINGTDPIFSVTMVSLSYIPIAHSLALQFCSTAPMQSLNVTGPPPGEGGGGGGAATPSGGGGGGGGGAPSTVATTSTTSTTVPTTTTRTSKSTTASTTSTVNTTTTLNTTTLNTTTTIRPRRNQTTTSTVNTTSLTTSSSTTTETTSTTSVSSTTKSTTTKTTSTTSVSSTSSIAGSSSCPNEDYEGDSSTTLTFQQIVACAQNAGFSGTQLEVIVAAAYQESSYMPGATGPGITGGCTAQGILQEGECGSPGEEYFIPGVYDPTSCSTYGGGTNWSGIYYNPTCAFQWAYDYVNSDNSSLTSCGGASPYCFWGSVTSGAYCQYAPTTYSGYDCPQGENILNFPWSEYT